MTSRRRWSRTSVGGSGARSLATARRKPCCFWFGPKGSGKSTIADTLLHIAGSYGATLAAEHVIGDTNQHRSWLARLDRKRLVRINEMPQRGAWKTADLLSLTSGEMVTANHMRQDPFEFRSRAAVLATGNHAPLAPSSSGYWRRLRLADCRHQIPDEKQDDTLRLKLRQGSRAHPAVGTRCATGGAALTGGDVDGRREPARRPGSGRRVDRRSLCLRSEGHHHRVRKPMRNTLIALARRGNLLRAEHLTDSWQIGSGRHAPCVSTGTYTR